MPRPKKENWSRVTITLSDECIKVLRHLNGVTGEEMGAIADATMRQGGLFERLSYALGTTHTLPPGLSAKDIKPHTYILPEPSKPIPAPPAAPAKTPNPSVAKKAGNAEVFQQLQAAIASKAFTQADLDRALGFKGKGATYRDWKKRGTVPAEHVEGVLAFLKERGIESAKG